MLIKLIRFRKAQATAEYAILFAVVIGAAMGVQTYVKRGLQARVYDAVNQFIDETGGTTQQWEHTSGSKTTYNQYSRRDFIEDPDNTETPYIYNETMSQRYDSNTNK